MKAAEENKQKQLDLLHAPAGPIAIMDPGYVECIRDTTWLKPVQSPAKSFKWHSNLQQNDDYNNYIPPNTTFESIEKSPPFPTQCILYSAGLASYTPQLSSAQLTGDHAKDILTFTSIIAAHIMKNAIWCDFGNGQLSNPALDCWKAVGMNPKHRRLAQSRWKWYGNESNEGWSSVNRLYLIIHDGNKWPIKILKNPGMRLSQVQSSTSLKGREQKYSSIDDYNYMAVHPGNIDGVISCQIVLMLATGDEAFQSDTRKFLVPAICVCFI